MKDSHKEGSHRVPVIILIVLAVAIGIVYSQKSHRRHLKKGGKQHSLIYRDREGRRYTKTHDDVSDAFDYWASADFGDSSSPASTASWQRITNFPSGLTPTKEVVEEVGGKPTSAVEEESALPEDEAVIEESTTESQVESAESPSSDSGSADSDSGGDSGGGDSGGGGDGGD